MFSERIPTLQIILLQYSFMNKKDKIDALVKEAIKFYEQIILGDDN